MFTHWPKSHVKLWYLGYRLYYLVRSLSTSAVLPGAKCWRKSILGLQNPAFQGTASVCEKSKSQMQGSFVNNWSWYLDRGEIWNSLAISLYPGILRNLSIWLKLIWFSWKSILFKTGYVSLKHLSRSLSFSPWRCTSFLQVLELVVLSRFLCTVLNPLPCPQFYFWKSTASPTPLFLSAANILSLSHTHLQTHQGETDTLPQNCLGSCSATWKDSWIYWHCF